VEERRLLSETREALSELSLELEALRKSQVNTGIPSPGPLPNRELSASNHHDPRRDSNNSTSSKLSRRSGDPARDENLRDQVTGLKYVVMD